MKNSIFKKLVALSLVVLMLAGSGIGAALAGIDLAGIVGINASAENPKNSVLYDSSKGLFFTVDSAATIVGTNPDALKASEDYEDGAYTLPNQVSADGHIYNVSKVNHFAFMNSRADITKIIIPNSFNDLYLTSAAFAGMDNLSEFELHQPDVVTEGPLFELVCSYKFDETEDTLVEVVTGYDDEGNPKTQKIPGAIANSFPYRNEYGVFQLNEDESEATIWVYSKEIINGITDDYAVINIPFNENLDKLTNINTVSKEDIDTWNYLARFDVETTHTSAQLIGKKSGEPISIFNVSDDLLPYGFFAYVLEEVSEFTAENIVDGNGSQGKASTIVLHKSPVAAISFGDEITTIPDYFFYDTDIKGVNLSKIEKIGKFAFVDCDGLTSVDLGNVSEIDEYAFAACDGLTEVTIPENMQKLGDNAFTLCDNLDIVKYNATDCTVGNTPFTDSGVTTMIFGKDVTTVPSNIGAEVSTLNSVIFLADTGSLTISEGAFRDSGSINEVDVMDEDEWENVNVGANNGSIKAKNTEIGTHDHSYVTTTYPATCSAEGYTADVCVCGEEKNKRDIQAKTAHTLSENKTSTVKATCEGEGYDLYICTECGEAVKQNVQQALGHDYSDIKTYPATCTEGGKTIGTCTRCKNEITMSTTDPLGHDFGEYTYNNDATETRDGTETARCSRCDAVDIRTAPGTSIQSKLGDVVFNAGEEKSVEYRSKVVITSRAENVPEGFYLVIMANNKVVASGDNEEVTYTVDEITEDTVFNTFIFNSNGKPATKNPFKTDKADVNTGFFAKVIAFFKALFGLLPTVNFGK